MAEIISIEKDNKNLFVKSYSLLFNKNSGFTKAVLITVILLIIAGPTVIYEIFFANAATITEIAGAPINTSFTTEFGFEVEPPIYPNKNQFTTLNPGWIRMVIKGKCNMPISYLPPDVKVLAIFNNQSCNNKAPLKSKDDKVWENYINKYYIPDLQKFLKNNSNVTAIELWNEEDICSNSSCPKVPTYDYSLLLAKATAVIKNFDAKNNKHILAVTGGVASGNTNYLTQVLKNLQNGNLVKQYPTTLNNLDGIGLHPYGQSPDNGALLNTLTKYSKVAGKKPIWITEIGTDANNGDINGLLKQQTYLGKIFTIFQQQNIPVAIWYAFSDKMPGSNNNKTWGLYDVLGKIKPSGSEFSLFTKGVKGTVFNFYISLQFINKNGGIGQKINNTPATPNQTITLYLYKINKNPSADLAGDHADYKETVHNAISYSVTTGFFTTSDKTLNKIIIPQNITGKYSLLIKVPGYLRKYLGLINLKPSIQKNGKITMGSSASPIHLESGDLNDDNRINLIDYNLLLACFPNSKAQTQCPKTASLNDKPLPSDSNSLGNYWSEELSLLLQNFQQINGD